MQYFRTTATLLNDIVDGIWWLFCKDEADKTEEQDQDQPQRHTSNEEPHSGKKASLELVVMWRLSVHVQRRQKKGYSKEQQVSLGD